MRKVIMILIGIVLSLSSVLAQNTVLIRGRVVSLDEQLSLDGVSVVSIATNKGTVTDADGKFSLQMPPGTKIRISAVGYEPLELVGTETEMLIELKPKIKELEQAVVIGFGTQTRRTLTGSVSKISTENLTNVANPNFQNAMQGLAAGLNVTGTSGLAGSPARVRIRGTGSIFSNGEPLYVIDGVPVDADNSGLFANTNRGGAPPANPMANIDPDDIESMDVLKDAAASAIFGARAANGVIVITTKRGKQGKTRFSANVSYGSNRETNRVAYANGNDYMALRQEAIANSRATGIIFNGNLGGVPPIYLNGGYNQWFANAVPPLSFDSSQAASVAAQNINHLDDVFRRGQSISAQISASGGSEKTNFFTSLSYMEEDGFLIRNDFSRINGRVNIDHQATKTLKIGVQASGSFTANSLYPIGPPSQFAAGFNPGGFFNATNSVLPVFPRYFDDGTLWGVPQGVNNIVFQDENLFFNTVNQQRYLTNIYGDLKLGKYLSFRSEWGNDFIGQITRFYMSPVMTTGGEQGVIRGVNDFRTRNSNTINANNFFTYKRTLKDVHQFDWVLGSQYTYNNSRSSQIRTSNIPAAPSLNTTQVAGVIDAASDRLDQYLYLSAFTRISYNYDRKYLLGASFRRDGSSRFGTNYRWANFPSFSAGWVLSEEKFLKNKDWISFLKLRTSWGLTGNSNPGGVEAINFGGFGVGQAFYAGNIGYPFRRVQALAENVRWEKTQMLDLGLDFGFLENRLNGSVNYYERNTSDLILGANPMPGTGIIGGRNFLNIGAMRNWGWEFTVSAKVINGKDFKWQVDANAAYNQNKVTDLGGLSPVSVAFGVNRVFEGMPISTYWLPMYLGADEATGYPVFADVQRKTDGTPELDGNGYPQHDPSKRIVVDPFGRMAGTNTNVNWEGISAPMHDKPGQPLWTGGVTNTFSYKGLSVSALITFSTGNWIYDQGAQNQAYMLQTYRNVQEEFIKDRWLAPGDVTNNHALFFNPVFAGQATSRFLYKGDFARLRNLRISYDLPKNWVKSIKLEKCQVYFNATNLITWTRFPGWDPEVSGTLSFQDFNGQPQNIAASQTNGDPPQARNISFGALINF